MSWGSLKDAAPGYPAAVVRPGNSSCKIEETLTVSRRIDGWVIALSGTRPQTVELADLSFRNFRGWLFTTLTTTQICTCPDRDGASSQVFPTLFLQETSRSCALGRGHRLRNAGLKDLSGSTV
jgi:hypothetical protein